MELEAFHGDDYVVDVLKRQGSTVLRVAFSYLRNMPEAEDIYQEVFLKLLEETVLFQNEEHERAWLIRVAINLCKNRLKSFWRTRIFPLEDNILVDKDETAVGVDVFNAVMSLKVKYRTVIHLFYYEDYSTLEISRLTGWSEASVRTSLHRARKALSGKLEGVVFSD